ncbi:MAG: succinate dehydrogenase iron-sulfur subunit [Syntrophaceae bacterium]|jgi:succinate dehydrogenase/fumarate reductase iron-sulfur protein|nr:succinate dehydrogenase iron-sulfur subunit [Syntrophaceae bacterium]
MIYTFDIFRYDPKKDSQPYRQEFQVDLGDADKVTVLDALFKIQQTQDRTLSFRYSCRLAMCGSCALVMNGREGLACKTLVKDLGGGTIFLEPLRHIPVVKDLTVDLKFLIRRLRQVEPYFVPRSPSPEPAQIRPDSAERKTIGLNTECIACGSCVSSCTMMYWNPDYIGPMGLNRAFCLIADSRDLSGDRLSRIAGENGIYRCHMEFNCTDVCPKHISPTRGIHHLKRQVFKAGIKKLNPFRRGRTE